MLGIRRIRTVEIKCSGIISDFLVSACEKAASPRVLVFFSKFLPD